MQSNSYPDYRTLVNISDRNYKFKLLRCFFNYLTIESSCLFDLNFQTLGNQYERCGNTNTIVVLRKEEHKSTFMSRYIEIIGQNRRYPNFIYHSCVDLSSANESAIYHFNLTCTSDVHPRHCVELCTNYKQHYSLLNSNRCLCTNIPMEKLKDKLFEVFPGSKGYTCTQECQANYFYTCGNTNNSNIYIQCTSRK